jgi:hypothetical protein
MLKRVIAALSLALCLGYAREAWSDTISFQEGIGGYTGTQDTEIDQGDPTLSFGSATSVRVDLLFNGGDVQGLLRFDGLFGALPGQIPLGSTINSAVLTLNVTNSTLDGIISVYRMTTTWSESSTWNSLVAGVQIGSETAASADAAQAVTLTGATTFDVLASLQAWSSGASNFGWVIFNSSTDGIAFDSSETGTAALRPLLAVDYTPVPEPGSLVLAGLAGAAALCVRRLRRRA